MSAIDWGGSPGTMDFGVPLLSRAVDDTISALFFHIVNRHRQLRSLTISYRQSTSTVSQTVDTISANEIIVGDISSPVIGK
jgi:hypothetical protein